MKKNLLKIYEGFFDNITDDLDKLNPNQDDGFGDVNSGIYDEHDFILSPYKNPEFFYGLCKFCEDYYKLNISPNKKGFTQKDLDKITYLDTFFYVSYFQNVTSLDELQYFHNLEKIHNFSFYQCTKLKSIKLPENLKEIYVYSFLRCLSLEKIIIPKNIKIIEHGAFEECKSLKEIIIPEKFKNRIESIFDNVNLTKVNITYI